MMEFGRSADAISAGGPILVLVAARWVLDNMQRAGGREEVNLVGTFLVGPCLRGIASAGKAAHQRCLMIGVILLVWVPRVAESNPGVRGETG